MQSMHFLLGGLRLTIFSITLVHKHSRLRLPLDPGQELHCTQDFQRPSILLRSRCKLRIGQGQVRKKLRQMMKRTQMKKPDFFCDIEFVTVAMVFVFFCISDDQLSCFCICNIHLSCIYLKFLKDFVHIIPVRVFKERKINS